MNKIVVHTQKVLLSYKKRLITFSKRGLARFKLQ